MKKLYYMTYHQHLGQDTRYLAEGLIVSDEELQQETHFSIGEESYICSAVPLPFYNGLGYFIEYLYDSNDIFNL